MSTLTPSRVLLPLGLAACLSLFGDLTLCAVLASQAQVVGLTLGAVGVMLGIHRLIRIAGNPLAGQLYDRWGRRPLFLAGATLGHNLIVKEKRWGSRFGSRQCFSQVWLCWRCWHWVGAARMFRWQRPWQASLRRTRS